MKKPKKPNYDKWVTKAGWTWWQAICLMSEIDPPKDLPSYFKLRDSYKPLKDRENKFRDKGFFEEFGIPYPETFC